MSGSNRQWTAGSAVFVTGGAILLAGVVIVLGALIFNWVTIGGDGGANIGAGILFLFGVAVSACGAIVFLAGAIMKLAKRGK